MSNHAATTAHDLHNQDVRWDGTALGLQPRIVNADTAAMVADRAMPDAQLVELLLDPERFAVAHVVLTMRHDALTSFDAGQWNGLRVTLEPSGAVRYDREDMAALHDRWSAALR